MVLRNELHGPLADVPICFNILIAGVGSLTKTLAVAVFPVPPFVEPTVTELTFTPVVVPCTLTESIQEELAARLTPFKLTVPEPAVADAVPPHVLERSFGVATTSPEGSESLKFTPVKVVPELGF